jgi:hypothetical protein
MRCADGQLPGWMVALTLKTLSETVSKFGYQIHLAVD